MNAGVKRELVTAALVRWGAEAQIKMVIGECCELCSAIVDLDRGRLKASDVVDEIADVEIMLDFMRLYYGDSNVDKAVEKKLKRLAERLEES